MVCGGLVVPTFCGAKTIKPGDAVNTVPFAVIFTDCGLILALSTKVNEAN
jgi:hypothetical protein